MGYELKCGIQLNASYKIGLTDALKAEKETAIMLPNTICIGVGYRFGKK